MVITAHRTVNTDTVLQLLLQIEIFFLFRFHMWFRRICIEMTSKVLRPETGLTCTQFVGLLSAYKRLRNIICVAVTSTFRQFQSKKGPT